MSYSMLLSQISKFPLTVPLPFYPEWQDYERGYHTLCLQCVPYNFDIQTAMWWNETFSPKTGKNPECRTCDFSAVEMRYIRHSIPVPRILQQ